MRRVVVVGLLLLIGVELVMAVPDTVTVGAASHQPPHTVTVGAASHQRPHTVIVGAASHQPPHTVTVGAASHQPPHTVTVGAASHRLEPEFVSFVMDTASLPISDSPGGVFPSYPYPVDLTSAKLRGFASALAPSLFVMTSGAANCISYGGYSSKQQNYQSEYCKEKLYSGTLDPTTWQLLLNFTVEVGAGLVWHLVLRLWHLGEKSSGSAVACQRSNSVTVAN